ncbi:DUF4041 domain-containing protein [Kutzneria kofuensis]|uniref:Type II secretory pathway pseudopilin PulG n=1 Tax=Kutzneria kofuensis TaxID=103725 RepID=A0A7W9NKE7_9PSEU|nr:DUF4041 domain-containing protein [Kutzneria kofuensis]MBB5895178.1 type II secretory pathway pseudopilin PulG [Kutzneria kofuensis]
MPDVPQASAAAAQPQQPVDAQPPEKRVGLFAARKRLPQVEAELQLSREQERRLQGALHQESSRATQLAAQLAEVSARYDELRGRDAVALENDIANARRLLAKLTADAEAQGASDAARQSEASNALMAVHQQVEAAQSELQRIRGQIVETQELALLQEAGIYEFRHRLADSVAYKASLERLKDAIKTSAKNNHAITATTNWTVNNSAVEGQRMVRDFSKLMLRAYNTEADNCVRSMRPHRLESSKDRLTKVRDIISRLGKTMHINIASGYHRLRIEELELTADYLAKVEEEKERVRAERERQRDEAQAQREFEREKARLAKELSHWRTAMQKWTGAGDAAKIAEAESKLAEIGEAIKGVEEREANIRTGWVYVISNVGSFGHDVVKIGLTRRLDPTERVRELGDASVPFKFDVHALIFDADAVSLETRLHQRLDSRRVNRVNLRREFFHVTPAEVLDILHTMGLQDNLVDYVEEPEAEEWRSSQRLSDAEQGARTPAA